MFGCGGPTRILAFPSDFATARRASEERRERPDKCSRFLPISLGHSTNPCQCRTAAGIQQSRSRALVPPEWASNGTAPLMRSQALPDPARQAISLIDGYGHGRSAFHVILPLKMRGFRCEKRVGKKCLGQYVNGSPSLVHRVDSRR